MNEESTGPERDEDVDPALVAAVVEIEGHVAADGWDQASRLFALADTAELVTREPDLAASAGIDDDGVAGSLTPIEQEQPGTGQQLEELLAQITWPEQVVGCVAVVERLVLPPEVDEEIPEDPEAADAFAREHPMRQEVRLVAGATRTGAAYCALRLRSHDDDQSVLTGTDLVPQLVDLLRATLEEETSSE